MIKLRGAWQGLMRVGQHQFLRRTPFTFQDLSYTFAHNFSRAFCAAANPALPPAFTEFDFPQRLLYLHDIQDNPGSRKKKKRVGRGPGSHLGKTCGKGHKGTYARHRLRKRGFEGNQAPLWKVTPKHGHKTKGFSRPLNVVNLGKIQQWISKGRLNPAETITIKKLWDSGILGNAKVPHGVKILSQGVLNTAVHLEVTHASERAKASIEAAGGSVKYVWFAKIPLRAHLKPHKFDLLPRSNGIPPQKYFKRYGVQLALKPLVQELVQERKQESIQD